jgi:DNA polymerase (family 10)
MNTGQIALVLEAVAGLLEFKDENPFKVRAYRNAARAIESFTGNIEQLCRDKKLCDIPGVGKAIEEKITQLINTGKMDYYEELQKEIPEGVVAMCAIPSFGPKKARVVWQQLGITTIDALKQACLEDKLSALKGFGAKTQKKILEGIEFHAKHAGQFLLSDAIAGGEAAPRVRPERAHCSPG